MLKCLVLLLFLSLFLIPTTTYARMEQGVDINATGDSGLVPPPTNLIITYLNDNAIQLDWTVDGTIENSLLRAAFGREVIDRNDGIEVYYGENSTAIHWIDSLESAGTIYYSVWAEISGNWSSPLTGEANFMSQSFLFIGLIALAGLFTFLAWRRRNILISLSAALTWLALGFWVLLGEVSNLDLADSWTKIIAWVFIMMAFVSFLFLMDTEIKHERDGTSWTEYGPRPKKKKPSPYDEHRKSLRERMGRK